MDKKIIKVLDHGFIQLVDHLGDDQRICDAARVSLASGESFNDSAPRTEKENKRLIRYLISHAHTSPFEQVEFVFVVNCPIFVARQWMRHRTWNYNEISGRYTTLPSHETYIPEMDSICRKSESIKQGRGPESSMSDKRDFLKKISASYSVSNCVYKEFIDEEGYNFAREIARLPLPLSTYTRFYAKCDLSNLLKFVGLRIKPNSQKEIQVYAQAILELIEPIVPFTIKYWKDHVLNSKRFSYPESKFIKSMLEKVDSAILGEKDKKKLEKILKGWGNGVA